MIPRIIHQIWLGDQNERPDHMIQTWIDKNPTWTHMLWTEDNLPPLVNGDIFRGARCYPGKADVLRYEILYRHGGFFIDADSVCINPLPDYLTYNDSFCCWENEYVRTGLMANGYLGATKGNTPHVEPH